MPADAGALAPLNAYVAGVFGSLAGELVAVAHSSAPMAANARPYTSEAFISS